MELSNGAKKLLTSYETWNRSLQPNGTAACISVDDVAAKVASFYEKIRGVVDWREEHLLRKTAIERIFKRRILLNGNTAEMAEPLLIELIRGGHFPSGRIQTSKIEEVQRVISKYAFLIENSKAYATRKEYSHLEQWLHGIGACEIEETLAPPLREKALIAFMSEDMEKSLQIRQRDAAKISEEERKLQIFTGVQRALFKLDEATISLHVLERFYPNWSNVSQGELSGISQKLAQIISSIDGILRHPLREKFYQIIERLDTPYLLLGDIISDHPTNFSEIAGNPEQFEQAVSEAYDVRLKKLKSRMKRAAFFSTLSVFVSKVVVAMAIEIPVDTYITQEINYGVLGWSIAIPPLFLLFLITTKKSSSKDNVQKVLLAITKITYENERMDAHEISLPAKRKSFISWIVRGTYLLSFLLSFGTLFIVLRNFHFSILSTAVFLLFLSLVSYAGMRIRQRTQELMIEEHKDGLFFTLLDFFILPVTQVGRWFSSQLARYNVLVLLLNVLIETPFQVFVEFIEQLRTFWREKKDQIQ
ncbi:MAG: hypothetical protein HYS60_00980 [Candidatus Wildermuthbacteria bacterium]|nr:hypothetical protein [Candidatus Wildermuthbacteria bacterium]